MNMITIEELSDITGYCTACIRAYLQGYRFTRFEYHAKVNNRTRLVYLFNQEFVDEFTKFIWKCKRIDIKQKMQKKLLSLAKQENSSY